MSAMMPAAVYGLQVPAGDAAVPAAPDFPATFRITMAAIDPSATPQPDEAAPEAPARATLKILRMPMGDADSDDSDSDYDDDTIEAIKARLADSVSDDESDELSDDEKNGGPSDPEKLKKLLAHAFVKKLKDAAQEDEEMEDAAVNGVNGTKDDKGKGKAKATDEEEGSESDGESEDIEVDEFVLCTLDPSKHYQQPLDITVGERERVFFKVSGAYDVYLTGNYVLPPHDDFDDDYSDDGPLGLTGMDSDGSLDDEDISEEDELDDIDDPRVMEVDTDEEDAPKLVKAAEGKPTKGKNKRVASDSYDSEKTVSLDDMINKSLKPSEAAANGEKPSAKQAKKLKNNAGHATTAPADEVAAKKMDETTKNAASNGKKVQFAKNLEQGPTPSPTSQSKVEPQKSQKGPEGKPAPGAKGVVKVVQGVTIDDRKMGAGAAAKKGDKVGMRYIGKLEKNGKVFDSNKKGKPFAFKLGSGEVIKGWDIGVTGMQIGGERKITIPAVLAYGSKGAPPDIPPNSNLIFEMKMIAIN